MKLRSILAVLVISLAVVSIVPAVPQAKPSAKTLAAGETKVNAKDGLTYVWIPSGTFQMGCSPADADCEEDEKPTHTTTLTKGFWMGQTEVTQAAYKRVMRTNPSFFNGDRLPVEHITWPMADAYCQAAGMRLPTEAEWEYAARAGSTASRYGELDAIAWYGGNSGEQPHEVGQKQPNAWGLYDMLGNVLEWAEDWYDANYYSQSPPQDPPGPIGVSHRVVRGGNWESNPSLIRASLRGAVPPGTRFRFGGDKFGFRCAGEVP